LAAKAPEAVQSRRAKKSPKTRHVATGEGDPQEAIEFQKVTFEQAAVAFLLALREKN
jgi:hypothetical protein